MPVISKVTLSSDIDTERKISREGVGAKSKVQADWVGFGGLSTPCARSVIKSPIVSFAYGRFSWSSAPRGGGKREEGEGEDEG